MSIAETLDLPKCLRIYGKTILPDLDTRNDLFPRADGSTSGAPHHPLACLLEPAQLLITKAKKAGELSPIDLSHINEDTRTQAVPVFLVVYPHTQASNLGNGSVASFFQPRDRHMGIRWVVPPSKSVPSAQHADGEVAARSLELISSYCHLNRSRGISPFLINWGPRTTPSLLVKHLAGVLPTHSPRVFELGRLSLEQRRELEAIAWNVAVVEPDGEFNCQNWAAAVLAIAVRRKLLSKESVEVAFRKGLVHGDMDEVTGDVLNVD